MKENSPKLKIGVLLEGVQISNWWYTTLQQIKEAYYAEIVLVIIKQENIREEESKPFFYKLHVKVDKFLFSRNTNYESPRRVEDLFQNAKQLNIEMPATGEISSNDIDQIKSQNLDILLQSNSFDWKKSLAPLVKYGLWRLKHSEAKIESKGPSGYWEFMTDYGTVGFILQQWKGGEENILHESIDYTHLLSIDKTRSNNYWNSSIVIPRILEKIFLQGPIALEKLQRKYSSLNGAKIALEFDPISTFSSSKNFYKYLMGIGKRAWQKWVSVDHWYILFQLHQENFNPFEVELGKFIAIESKADKFWADPFVVSEHNQHYIFVEEYPYKDKRGHLSVIVLDENGKYLESGDILKRPYHLSYPFVFKQDDTYYMMPESHQNKTVELYRCIEFPYKWEFVIDLMTDIIGADATLFFRDDKWWLFANVDPTGGQSNSSSELHLFFCDNLFAPSWQSHPDNPISSDSKVSRPAGKIFEFEGKFYRPTQEGNGVYGRATNFMEITKWTETDYEEQLFQKIEPNWDEVSSRTHTFNFNQQITVVDGFSYRKKKGDFLKNKPKVTEL